MGWFSHKSDSKDITLGKSNEMEFEGKAIKIHTMQDDVDRFQSAQKKEGADSTPAKDIFVDTGVSATSDPSVAHNSFLSSKMNVVPDVHIAQQEKDFLSEKTPIIEKKTTEYVSKPDSIKTEPQQQQQQPQLVQMSKKLEAKPILSRQPISTSQLLNSVNVKTVFSSAETVSGVPIEKKNAQPLYKNTSPMMASSPIGNSSQVSTAFSKNKKDGTAGLDENVVILAEGFDWKKIVVVVVAVFVFGGGAFFFWQTRSLQEISVNQPQITPVQKLPEKNSSESRQADFPFSTENPNAFLVDVETETVSMLREKLIENARKMKESGMFEIVPFSIVDKRNTPIAFFIFASIFNLGLSSDLLNNLENDFTLYLFVDNDIPRVGFTLRVKSESEVKAIMLTSEKTLPLSLKNLILSEDILPTAPSIFQDATYRDQSLRFFNFFAPSTSPSVDYAVVNGTFIVGTSKETTRALVDGVLDAKK